MFFTKEEESRIVEAIRIAELKTSGEIRVFMEDFCDADDPVDRAAELFATHKMNETQNRNGVLIYIAHTARQFAIWGDSGVHERAGQLFWEKEKHLLRRYLQKDESCAGICTVIHEIGDILKINFPADKNNNPNELPNDIIYG
jgi:uncharacterized membrane protein